MNKFWQWMEDKGYGKNKTLINRKADWQMSKVHLTKQMLIGYMIEFLSKELNVVSIYPGTLDIIKLSNTLEKEIGKF